MSNHFEHGQAMVVACVGGLATAVGALDWVAPTFGKIAVAFTVAVFSGLGYQVGRAAYAWLRKQTGKSNVDDA